MPDFAPVTAETLAGMSGQLTSPAVPEAQLPPVVAMLNSLAADMADSRKFNVGEAEPALIYNSDVAQ